MSPDNGRTLSESQHRAAAHDLPLMFRLLDHHSLLIFATYDPAIRQKHPLAVQARKAVDELFKFKKLLHDQAKKEHPAGDFLNQYEAEHIDTACWPPNITDKEEVEA